MKVFAIILASGKGERFKSFLPKQFTKLSGKTVLEHTVEILEKQDEIDEIIIITLPEFIPKVEEFVLENNWKKVSKILAGGKTRQESSYIGLQAIKDENSIVLIHDAVRPFVSERIIKEVIDKLKIYKAVDVAIPSADTIIKIKENNLIDYIPERRFYWRGQTPQGFHTSVIKKAHEKAIKENFQATDDCGLVLRYNLASVYVVKGEEENIKITTPLDIYITDKIFQLKSHKIVGNYNLSSLKGKVGVIFGSRRGIGESLVKLCRKYKVKVYGFSRRNGVDICDVEKVKKVLEEIYKREGRIAFVIVTAAVLKRKPLINFSTQEILEQIKINYIGSINVAQVSFPYLKESKGHLVLFTSSSYTRGRAFYSIYSSTKAAIVNLVQALSEEWEPFKIKINAICPERTATPMRFENFGKEPMKTLLNPQKVAEETLKVLLTEITGQVIEVRKDEEKYS